MSASATRWSTSRFASSSTVLKTCVPITPTAIPTADTMGREGRLNIGAEELTIENQDEESWGGKAQGEEGNSEERGRRSECIGERNSLHIEMVSKAKAGDNGALLNHPWRRADRDPLKPKAQCRRK